MNINQPNGYQKLLSMLGQSTSASAGNQNNRTTSVTDDAQPATRARLSDVGDYSDKVSLSFRAEKLQKISAEFFSGTISSSQIPALTQRLFEEGFLTSTDYQMLGGQTQTVSAISEASSFINRFILDEAVDGDQEAARELIKVADVLANMDLKTTPELRRAESDAYEFVANYAELLEEADAPADIQKGFATVLDVLSALDKVRKQEQSTGALSSYASVQEAYDDMYKESR